VKRERPGGTAEAFIGWETEGDVMENVSRFDSEDRLALENRVTDLRICINDLRQEIRRLVLEYRERQRQLRVARADLDFCDYLESIRLTFGEQTAAVVRNEARRAV
jgi:hypothetical protein